MQEEARVPGLGLVCYQQELHGGIWRNVPTFPAPQYNLTCLTINSTNTILGWDPIAVTGACGSRVV